MKFDFYNNLVLNIFGRLVDFDIFILRTRKLYTDFHRSTTMLLHTDWR